MRQTCPVDEHDTGAPEAMQRSEVERWLLRRGVPHLIHGYAPSRDIFTRVWWLLALMLLAESVAAVDRELAWWANALTVLGGLTLLVGGVAVVNTLLGRGALERPTRLGAPELTAFVLLPVLIPLVFGLQGREALGIAAFNLALLAVLYVVTGYGLVPMARWASEQLTKQLLDLANLLVRTLPLLALFSMFLFLNAELWQVASDAPMMLLGAACGLLVMVGVLFTLLRVPQELTALGVPPTWEEIEPMVADTPVAGLQRRSPAPRHVRLGWRARANLVLVGLFRLGVQIALASVLVGGFYVVFGVLMVREATIAQWTTNGLVDNQVLWRGDFAGATMVVTKPLLKVAAFLSAFGGLQVTVSALTDAAYREEFFEDLAGELRQVLAVRAAYLDQL